jgi:CelD/BcsL family acetyltransferase involved in cellulose biosynthesis
MLAYLAPINITGRPARSVGCFAMHIRVVAERSEFDRLEAAWNVCVDHDEGRSLFLRHEWFRNLLNHVPDVNSLRVVVAEQHGRVVGLLPGCVRRETIHRFGFRALTFMSNYYSPFAAVVRDRNSDDGSAAVERALFRHVASTVSNWDVMILQSIPEERGALDRTRAALASAGLPYTERDQAINWHLPCAGMSYADYLESRGQKRKKKLQYERRRLEAMSGFSFHLQTAADDDLEASIAAYYEVYGRSWKQHEPYPHFHADLMRESARRGWLRLGLLRLNDVPVAAQLWLVYEGTASIVKVAYDDRYGKYSPGTVLTLALLEHVLDVDHVAEVDFLSGNDPYKREWMTHSRLRRTLLVYNPRSIAGASLRFFDTHVYPLLAPWRERRAAKGADGLTQTPNGERAPA